MSEKRHSHQNPYYWHHPFYDCIDKENTPKKSYDCKANQRQHLFLREIFILYFFGLLFACSNFFQFFPECPDACTRTTAKGYKAAFVHDKSIDLWSGLRDIFAHIILYHFKIGINQVRVRDVYPLNKFGGLICLG